MRTDLDKKLARKPNLINRATTSMTAVIIANAPARATYCDDSGVARPTRPAARIAAVAESAPTTRWREEPRTAKTAIGSKIVYRPVMTGMPAIFV